MSSRTRVLLKIDFIKPFALTLNHLFYVCFFIAIFCRKFQHLYHKSFLFFNNNTSIKWNKLFYTILEYNCYSTYFLKRQIKNITLFIKFVSIGQQSYKFLQANCCCRKLLLLVCIKLRKLMMLCIVYVYVYSCDGKF